MGPTRLTRLRKRLPRWRPRVCDCSLFATSHTIRSRKAWRKHQIQLARLLAGARDAQPQSPPTHESSDSILDINSSIATDPYGGTDYQSLRGDEVSPGGSLYSVGDHRTTSSLEQLQYSGVSSSFPATTTASNSAKSEHDTVATSALALEHATNPGSGSTFRRPYTFFIDSASDTLDLLEESTLSTTESESATFVHSKSSTPQRMSKREDQPAEIRFLAEVEAMIGNPDDWTSSDDDSVAGDPFEVGLMKRGFIDEDLLEEELDPELLDLEDTVADLRLAGTNSPTAESIFPYENQQGKQFHFS